MTDRKLLLYKNKKLLNPLHMEVNTILDINRYNSTHQKDNKETLMILFGRNNTYEKHLLRNNIDIHEHEKLIEDKHFFNRYFKKAYTPNNIYQKDSDSIDIHYMDYILYLYHNHSKLYKDDYTNSYISTYYYKHATTNFFSIKSYLLTLFSVLLKMNSYFKIKFIEYANTGNHSLYVTQISLFTLRYHRHSNYDNDDTLNYLKKETVHLYRIMESLYKENVDDFSGQNSSIPYFAGTLLYKYAELHNPTYITDLNFHNWFNQNIQKILRYTFLFFNPTAYANYYHEDFHKTFVDNYDNDSSDYYDKGTYQNNLKKYMHFSFFNGAQVISQKQTKQDSRRLQDIMWSDYSNRNNRNSKGEDINMVSYYCYTNESILPTVLYSKNKILTTSLYGNFIPAIPDKASPDFFKFL